MALNTEKNGSWLFTVTAVKKPLLLLKASAPWNTGKQCKALRKDVALQTPITEPLSHAKDLDFVPVTCLYDRQLPQHSPHG
jgi:hypothetical protein